MNIQRITSRSAFLLMLFTSGCSGPSPNIDIGKLEPATCPVFLPDKSNLKDKLEFGYVTVPEEHSKPNGPVIQIAVARFKSFSDKPSPDPLVMNSGGPGDSNLDGFIPLLAGPMGRALLAKRDVVIIELRGLRHSKPNLICPEVFDAQMSMIDKDIKGDEANEILLSAMRKSHDRFVEEGINLSAYNNVETAKDIDVIMTALGYDKFNILGASAGTLVAQHVMRDSPNRVRAAVLFAAVPLGLPYFKNMMLNASESLKRMFDLCAADKSCSDAYPNLEEKFFSYLQALNDNPVILPVVNPNNKDSINFVLNGDRLATWIFSSMYDNTQIPHTLSKIMNGDYSEFQKNLQIFFPMIRFSYGLSYCIFSTGDLDFTAEEVLVDGRYAAFANGVSLFFGPKLLAQAKNFWKVTTLDRSLMRPVYSNIPTLILNGEMDHVLPKSYLEEMSSHLQKNYTYLFPGVAHLPTSKGPCAFNMALEFLDNPEKAPDSACLKDFTYKIIAQK